VNGEGPDRGGSTTGEVDLPRMADAFPKLVAEIDRLLKLSDPGHPLADAIGGLRYHGRCTCTQTCNNLLTAPMGSAGPYLAQLEREGADVIWLSLDPTCTTVVDIEVLDPTGLDIHSAANEKLAFPPASTA
jgi:hypothetical protein